MADVLTATAQVDRLLERPVPEPLQASMDDARAHRQRLIRPGFVAATAPRRLSGLARRRATGIGDDLRLIGWRIEELRVGLFAQHLGTRERVSATGLLRTIAAAA